MSEHLRAVSGVQRLGRYHRHLHLDTPAASSEDHFDPKSLLLADHVLGMDASHALRAKAGRYWYLLARNDVRFFLPGTKSRVF